MEQNNRMTLFTFAAPESKGSFKKICETAQKMEKLNEERNVAFDKKHKTSSIQNSMSDKQMTAYGKFSEEGVWDYDSWYESKICPDPPLPPFSLQQNKLVTQSPVSSSKTRLSWTTVQHDPSSLPCEDEIRGGGYAWPLPNSAQVVTDPHIHNLESGIGHLTSDAPQAEKEDFNEHQKKFSEEGVQAKVPSKRFLHYPDIFLPPINSAKGGKGEKRKKEREDHHSHHIGYSVMSGPLSKCSHKITDTPMYHPSRKKLLTTKPQGKAIVPPIAGPPGKPKTQSNSAPYSGAFKWDASSPHEPWNEMPVGGAWSRPSPSDSPFSLSSQDSWLDNRRYKSKIRRRYPNNASKRPILEKRVLPTKAHSDPYFKLTDTPLSLSSSSDKLLKGLAQSNVILPYVASHQFPQNSTMFPDGSSKEKQKEKAYPSKVTEPELPCSYGLTHEMTGGGYVWPGSSSAQRLTDPHIHNLGSGIGHLTSDAPQAEKEDFNEHQKKSLYKDQGCQTSTSEKQMTAGETFSEEGVQAKVPSKRFPHYPDIFLPPINSAKGGKGEKRKNESEDHHGHHIGYSVMSGPLSKRSCRITDTPMNHPSCKKLLTTKSQGKAIVPPIAGPPGKPKTQSNSAPYSGAFEWDASRPHEPWNEMSYGGAWSRPSPSDSPFSLSSQDSWLDNRRHKSKIRRRYPNNASKRPILEKRDHVVPTKAHSGTSFKLTDTPLSLSSSSDKLLKKLSQSQVILPSVAIRRLTQNSTMFPDGSSKEKQKEKAYPSKVTEPELPCSYGLTHEMTGGRYVWPGSSSAQRLTDPHIHNLESGIGHLTSDAPQAEKEDCNEHQKKSLYKDQGCQTSTSEKQMTAGETFSEEGVQAKVPSKRVPHYPDIFLPPINSAKGEKGEKRKKEREDHHGHHIGYSVMSAPLSKRSCRMTDTPMNHPSCKKLLTTKSQGKAIVPPIAGPPGKPKTQSNSAPYSGAFKWDASSPHEPWNEMPVGGAWSRPSPSDSPFSLSSQDNWLDNRRYKSKIRRRYPNNAAKRPILEKRVLPTKAHSDPYFKLTDTPLSLSSSSDKLLKGLAQSNVILPSVASHQFPQNSTMFPDGSSKEKQKEKAYPSKVTEPELPCSYGLTHEMTGGRYVWPGSSSAQVCADLQRCYPDITGESLKKDDFELAVQSESEPGGDHSTLEEMGPPVTAEHSLTKNPLPVRTPLQQSLEYLWGGTADLYSPYCSTSSPYLMPDGSAVLDLPEIHPQNLFMVSPPPFQSFSSKPSKIKCRKASHSIGSLLDLDSPNNLFYQPHFILPETGMIKNRSPAADASTGFSQDNTREMDLHETAGPSTLQLSTSDDDDLGSAAFYDRTKERDRVLLGRAWMRPDSPPSLVSDNISHPPRRKDTDDGDPSFNNSSSAFSRPSCSRSTGGKTQDAFELLSVQSEGESGGDSDAVVELEASVIAVKCSVTNTQSIHSHLQLSSSDPGWTERGSSCLSRSHSVPSLSQTTSPENKTFTRSHSLPDLLLKSSFEEFTPDISVDEDDETYWFQCSCPGLYQCSVTGLVFHMEGEGDVVYRTVPWDRRLLAQHHKQPAGPLFDIKCLQQSVCQLHLPHCEIRSTGGCEFLSVAHVNDEGIEFIVPQKITETHVIINITGFSGFGNVKDEDSPPDPVRALVLLFYRPPADPDPESLLNVLLLPVNIVLRDVLHSWNKLAGDEIYIKVPPHCKLRPKQEYTLSTCPEDDSVLVQPTEAEFDCDNYDNYFPSFQVILEKIMRHIKLFLREANNYSVWERRVCLSSTAVKKSCRQGILSEKLFDIRSSFIDGISVPNLKSLLDKLLEKKVITDPERESADAFQDKGDKARFVIDTVRKKGETASSDMIEVLCDIDPLLCEGFGLI